MTDVTGTDRDEDPLPQMAAAALEALEAEREALLSGAYHRLADLAGQKTALLGGLEDGLRTAPRTEETVALVRRLIAAARRNEALIAAARQGLAAARRQLRALADARDGLVAYAEDGTAIACRDDRVTTRHLA